MIVVRLMGGLGNQMFQYAAALSLAETRSTDVRIDKSWFEKHRDNVDAPRDYELGCFDLRQDFIEPEEYIVVDEEPRSFKRKIYLATKASKKPKLRLYDEPHYEFDPLFFTLPKNSVINGFWQSEKYFDQHSQLIRDAFTFSESPSGKNRLIADQIGQLGNSSVSLHVRRSDYANIKATKETHGLMGLAYYKEGVSVIENKIKNPVFFIISDDPSWCKKNIKINKHETVYVDHNTDGWKDMQLMSLCQNHIIANSSFSWWGAWLDKNPSKLVISPERWFADTSINTGDVIPAGWKRI